MKILTHNSHIGIIVLSASLALCQTAQAQDWGFSDTSGTLGWSGAAINWVSAPSSGWNSAYKMDGFKAYGSTAISGDMLGTDGYYMASPDSFRDWGKYLGGSLNIKMSEKTSGSEYHQTDGILGGGSHTYPGGLENSGFHEYETLPYVFMQTTVGGESTVLAAKLLYTSGEGEYSISFDADAWMMIDIGFETGDGPGAGETVTISGSFLNAADFAEAMENCSQIFIRGEHTYGGSVGGGDLEYLTLISGIYLVAVPEPSAYALAFGSAAIAIVAFRRRRR